MHYKYTSTEVLKYIDQLILEFNSITVEGDFAGKHKSRLIGRSLDFIQHREYVCGDDIKFIDWKVYARRDRFFVKQYQQEVNLTAYIFLDCSASMHYPEKDKNPSITKYEYGNYLASYISYILLNQGDCVGICKFDSKIRQVLPASSNVNYYYKILEFLEEEIFGEQTNFGEVFKQLIGLVKKKNMVIIISDFIDMNEKKIVKILRELSFSDIYLMILHIVDRTEELLELNYDNCILEDIEIHTIFVKTKVEEIKDYYRREFKKILEFYKENLNDRNIRYFTIRTELPLVENLKFILEQQ
ncbi:MAG: DUF58 domain-containing protein [Endomicrobia bacterium]|nr:DUF58 domain-containing protein [Endomicrobiia bacterium]